MSEITANWIFVNSRTFQRTEVYGPDWSRAVSGSDRLVPAPFGGPLLVTKDGSVHVHQASGLEISSWRWKNARIVACGWSNLEEAIFVVEDGSVFIYDLFGNLVKMFGMGQEAKDLKVLDAKIFQGKVSTGVAVVTAAKRFFVVNNIQEPRVRRMVDVDFNSGEKIVWNVLTDERQAKIIVAKSSSSVAVISQSEMASVPVDALQLEDKQVVSIAVRNNCEKLAILTSDGYLWFGTVEMKISSCQLDVLPDSLIWCAQDALLTFTSELSQCQIITMAGDREDTYLPDFVAAVEELDGVRVISLASQELIQEVPQALLSTFDLRISDSPSAGLRYAAEEFERKSHKADDYMRQIAKNLDLAVVTCIESAGLVFDPMLQKELLRAAQFGKSFLHGSSLSSAEMFTKMCVTLRILNALRDFRVGIPLTIQQYNFLTPRVVIDRLLARRLYPLALTICRLLNLPHGEGESRVLAHWACFKVGSSVTTGDDAATANVISKRLGHHPQLSYSDIASKAADCGKKELAIKLLEHEVRVSRQVPLLVQLGQESSALLRALASGNRDLAFSVLLHLRAELSSADFHIMIRKYPLGKVLYENYCRQYDMEALEDWFVQEDDFSALARHHFEQSYESSRYEVRMSKLLNVQECWQKAKLEPLQALTEENLKLMRHQSNLEEKLGKSFLGLTVNETICELLMTDQMKLAEKLKSELKVSDKRFAWFKVRAMVKRHQWPELKKYVKQKKQPLSMSQIVHLVKELAGERDAKEFLTEEFVTSHTERIDLYTEFGMFLEAANAAFVAKSVDSLTALEGVCGGREEVMRTIASFKAKLLSK